MYFSTNGNLWLGVVNYGPFLSRTLSPTHRFYTKIPHFHGFRHLELIKHVYVKLRKVIANYKIAYGLINGKVNENYGTF